ncbi:NCS1 family nucleobase:cation symporter-1 [Amycolatopsis jejuensis]|uniref:NCS1 family nucleobase:cation symporter-1 n=1 Tax=Amycolatopsis jejuensis TaxID=330084 RepID=UPI000A047A26|nr:NCS1 family nucleobase:cation symporter-1 [Amycolatopsis jejuensis]
MPKSDIPAPEAAVSRPDLAALDPSGRLYNEDLAPTPADDRRWSTYSLFALWMNDAHNVGVYTFAAAMFAMGLPAWQVTVGILLGIVVVFLGCNLSGFMGKDTGLPFPVVSRLSWGVFGANVPALIRAVVAIAWYGIQTYLASVAILEVLRRFLPGAARLSEFHLLGLDGLSWISFMLLWAIQLVVLSRGMEVVRHLQGWSGPALWLVMIAIAVWLVIRAGGDVSFTKSVTNLPAGEQAYQTLAVAGLSVGALASLMLNFSDFARFAPSRKSVVRGNFWGLPVNWTLFAVTSVVISAASVTVYGHPMINPLELLSDMDNGFLLVISAIVVVLAAVGVNIVANFVSPAYDLANVWPKRIDFRKGGLITAILAVVSLPWKLFSSPVVITYFMGGLGALLGPLFGVMATDYFLVRRQQVVMADLFTPDSASRYYYRRGVNPVACIAFGLGAVVALVVALVPLFHRVAPFSWFLGAAISAAVYLVLSRRAVETR